MSKHPLKPFMILACLCAAILVPSACGPRGIGGLEITLPPGVDNPCELTEDQVGQRVQVGGVVAFVDDVDPEWLYADLEADGCRVGITVETRTHQTWNEVEQATFTVGAQIVVQGYLASYPMPARPDEYQLIVELEAPPQALAQIPALAGTEVPSLAPLIGTACDLSHVDYLDDLRVEGEIVFVDDNAAAGLYAELDQDGCSVRIWVERTRWDTWSAAEQALFYVGETVALEGILTDVLHEPFLDLSLPPVRP